MSVPGASLKIGVTGPHSTGKTSILRGVALELRGLGFRVGSVSDMGGRCPLPILREHTAESTLWIVTRTIADELAQCAGNDVVLVDRPVCDAMAYYAAAIEYRGEDYNLQSPAYQALLPLVEGWTASYHRVFMTQIDDAVPIEEDGKRDLDVAFRRSVEKHCRLAVARFRPDSVELPFEMDRSIRLVVQAIREDITAMVCEH